MDKQQFECFTLSPLDGRYAGIKDALGEYFSEYALVKYRVFVEIQWLKFLIENYRENIIERRNAYFLLSVAKHPKKLPVADSFGNGGLLPHDLHPPCGVKII